MRAATFFDGATWREGVARVDDGRMLLREVASPAPVPRLDGVIIGGFTDHHVHLQLVEVDRLTGSRLGRVIDLGADPAVVASYAGAARLGTPRIEFAGAFLTPPGGYPSDRDWAPAGSFREIADRTAAASAVAEMAEAGASCIKVSSNSDAGPVFDDDLSRAIVALAADHGLPVVVHAQGAGEAQRAARLGARALAHAPFTERLTDEEIGRQAAALTWISTLSIHDGAERATAIDNVRRFHEAGGSLRYGTDMGNGPTPVDLHPGEVAALLEAGVDGVRLLQALAPADPRDPTAPLLLLPARDGDPRDARELTPDDLKA
ncbi:amidohydrolase family protein [Microbacterium sp. 179-I 3D3 NHS]|uniref:amidohydrolase family protein n=1 Tax=Microbacterium sp. 179-I 3D3 NHS TaxID=3142382 RepID=UPI00399FC07A